MGEGVGHTHAPHAQVRQTQTDPVRPSQTQTDPDRPRQTQTDPDRPRQTDRPTNRQTDRQTQTQTICERKQQVLFLFLAAEIHLRAGKNVYPFSAHLEAKRRRW